MINLQFPKIDRRGFTLIELLVVIAIIGLLSSIVFASLNTARVKARKSAVQQEMLQFRTLIEQAYTDTLGYSTLVSTPTGGSNCGPNVCYNWVNTKSQCDASYGPSSWASSQNASAAAQALSLCKAIISNINSADSGSLQNVLIIGSYPGAQAYDQTRYSLNVYFSGNATVPLYCVGTSGTNFNVTSGTPNVYYTPGCVYNP